MGSRINCVMGFLPANFQLAVPLRSWLRFRWGIERLTHRRWRHRAGRDTCPSPPQKKKRNLRAGARGAQQNLWGTCKKIKKINEKAKYSATELFSVSSLDNGHTATHQQLCRSHCVLCRRRQQSQSDTANSVRRHPVSQSGKRNPESTPIFCSRLDSGLVHSSRCRKYLNTFQNC